MVIFVENSKYSELIDVKRHLTFDATGQDLLTSSSNLIFLMSQRSCVQNFVTLIQGGHHELSWIQTDRPTDVLTLRNHKVTFRYLIKQSQ
jgi:hypothetical protein